MDKHERLTLAAGIRASGRGRLCDGYDGGELMSPIGGGLGSWGGQLRLGSWCWELGGGTIEIDGFNASSCTIVVVD